MINRRSKRRRERIANRRSGAAAIEFALLTPVVLLLILAGIDFGSVLYEKMRLGSAARAGVQYALQSNFSWQDLDGVRQSVRDATGLDPGSVTINTTQFCECGDGTAIECTNICVGDGQPRRYVNVTVDEEFPILFSYPGIDNPVSLTANITY